jgi:hypothetical protein
LPICLTNARRSRGDLGSGTPRTRFRARRLDRSATAPREAAATAPAASATGFGRRRPLAGSLGDGREPADARLVEARLVPDEALRLPVDLLRLVEAPVEERLCRPLFEDDFLVAI